MMNKPLIKDSVRNIWKKKVTALSIAVVVMLSVGVFLGVFYYMKALNREGTSYYKETNFKDFDIISSQGISEDEIDRLKNVEGISDIEGVNTISVNIKCNGQNKSITIFNLTERISVPKLIEGKLPESEDEIAINYYFANDNNIKIGDEITFHLGEDSKKLLKVDKYTVTGLITHPYNLRSGSSNIAVVPNSAFDMESNNNYYVRAIAKAEYSDELDVFSDEYFSKMSVVENRLRDECEKIKVEHTLEIKSFAQKELDDKKEEAETEISKAQGKIDDGWDEYNKKLKEGEDALNDARSKISYYEGYIDRGEEDLDQMSAIYNSKVAPVGNQINQVVDQYAAVDEKEKAVDDFVYKYASQTDAVLDEYNSVKESKKEAEEKVYSSIDSYNELSNSISNQIKSGRSKIAEGKNTLAGYKEELEKKEKEFDDAKKDGEDKLNDAQSQLDDKKKEAEDQIEEAEGQIKSIETTNYIIANRKMNYGYLDLASNLQTVNASAYCFALMFVIIAILVCFSSIYIIIDEQKELVGTAKSMGFFNKTIRSKYLIYGISSVVVGILFGFVLQFVLQLIFQRSLSGMYIFGIPGTYFSPLPAIFIVLINIFAAVFATYAACRKLLKLSAVQLMNGETIKKSKKKNSKSRTKKNLYSKLIARNIVSEKERVAISIVIIAGSCFVVGIGFSLKYANKDMMNRQLYDVQNYDISVNYDTGEYKDKVDEFIKFLDSNGVDSAKIASISTMYDVRGRNDYTRLVVAEADTFDKFYNIRDFSTGKRIKIDDLGVLIQSRFYEVNNVKKGDLFKIYDDSLKEHTVKVAGVFTNYAARDTLMTTEYYREVFGQTPEPSVLLIKLNGVDDEGIITRIKEEFPDATINTPQYVLDNYRSTFLIYDLIIMIMTFLAIVLSLFVLSNITNIFVNGKKNELIIMRINGFSTRQAIGYLIRENVLTILMSLGFALVAGVFLNKFVIGLFETDSTMFVRAFNPKAWLIAIVFELVFAFIIDLLSFRRVKSFKVTDINS